MYTVFRAHLSAAVFAFTSVAWAGTPTPVPTPPPSSAAQVSVIYQGSGAANFDEVYRRSGSASCPVFDVSAREDASNVNWKVAWKVRPSGGVVVVPQAGNQFSGQLSRIDSNTCHVGADFVCNSELANSSEDLPLMKIEKSGRAYILSLTAENQLSSINPTLNTCFNNSIFDNAIVDGLNQQNISELKIKISPAKERKVRTLKFTINKSFDCADPAKTLAFLANACSISADFSGTVKVRGRWKARLVK